MAGCEGDREEGCKESEELKWEGETENEKLKTRQTKSVRQTRQRGGYKLYVERNVVVVWQWFV